MTKKAKTEKKNLNKVGSSQKINKTLVILMKKIQINISNEKRISQQNKSTLK